MIDNNDLNPAEEQKHKTETRKLQIDEHFKDDALKKIKTLVSGNKSDPEAITLVSFDGEVLQFQAETILQIATKISNISKPGRVQGPVQIGSEVEAKEEIRKQYLALTKDRDTTRKIRETVLNRNDQGFAQDGIVIPLPFWRKEFVIFDECSTCRAKGTIQCQRCAGKGYEQCTLCKSSGMAICTQCRGGQQIVGPQGQKIPCPTCHGRGRMSCPQCNQSGQIQCTVCRTKGFTTCAACQGHAWTSNIKVVEIEGRTAFDYPREDLPEKVVAMVDARKDKIKDDAEIHISQLAAENPQQEEKPKAEQVEGRPDAVYRVPIKYEVILPYAHIEFEIEDKTYYTFLFGTKGRLTHVSPFIEDLIKNGVRKLGDAADQRGDVAQNLKAASEYRTVKDAIVAAARFPLRKAAQEVKKTNRLGISGEKIKELIVLADQAMKNTTDKPRKIGMAVAGVGFSAFFLCYFLTPLRGLIVGAIANTNIHIAVDGLILVLCLYLSTLVMQMTAAGAMKNALKGIIPPEQEKGLTPKLGASGFWTTLILIGAFLVALELSRHTGVEAPSWYAGLLARVGL